MYLLDTNVVSELRKQRPHGGVVAWLLFQWVGPEVPPIGLYQTKMDAMVLGFAWSAALGLGFSSANLRREHLQHT